MFRASSAVEMTPAVTLLTLPSGCPKFVWLSRLKISARNSSRAPPMREALAEREIHLPRAGPDQRIAADRALEARRGQRRRRSDRTTARRRGSSSSPRSSSRPGRVVDTLWHERPALADVGAGQREREAAADAHDALNLPAAEHVAEGPAVVQPAPAFAERQLVAEAERRCDGAGGSATGSRRHRNSS